MVYSYNLRDQKQNQRKLEPNRKKKPKVFNSKFRKSGRGKEIKN